MKKQFLLFLFLSLFLHCTSSKNKSLLINGGGASFPYILYSKWFSEYRKIEPKVAINYQSIGSGGGLRQLLKKTLDFGGTDIPVPSTEPAFSSIVHIPTCLGAVAVTYNLDLKSSQTLNFDARVLALIFQGKIKKWNDKNIQALNPSVALPDQPIVTVYRADGSGTNAFFTRFLASHSKSFMKDIGMGKSVKWPHGIGGKGNEGSAGLIKKIQGSIGYLSLGYAKIQKLPIAKIKNKSGRFVLPNKLTIREAATASLKKNKSYLASLIDMPGKNTYPLSGFTYIILFKEMEKQKGQFLLDFFKWSLKDGQKFLESLYFIPLPKSVVKKTLVEINKISLK